jgi:hypothetical protein
MSPAIPYTRILAAALTMFAALSLSSCGGSESRSAGNSQVAPTASGAPAGYIVPSRDRISTGDTSSVARFPTGKDNDEISETGAKPINPCTFVSASQAGRILGQPVGLTVGQQGPTCIYAAEGSKRQVTLVVERVDIAGLRHHASGAHRIPVGTTTGWCLYYDSSSVAVPLSGGRVLDVTGSCAVAARFAAQALGHGAIIG